MSKSVCKEKVFSSLYEKYAQDLHDFLYYKFGYKPNLNDFVQDAFIKLWDNCHKIPPEKARSFLFKVAQNAMLNNFKHEKVVLKYLENFSQKNIEKESPEFLLEEKEFYKKFQRALAKLSDEQRVAFTLNKIEGKKHKEIAEILNVTQKVVEYRIYSAFKIIKDEIKEMK